MSVVTPNSSLLSTAQIGRGQLPVSIPARSPRGNKVIAFGWYGGKFTHLDWLLPLLPSTGVHHYCEPYGGSAAVLLNRPPSPVETYNDVDGGVVNFFRVLRESPDELIRQIALTPFSRVEFLAALKQRSEPQIGLDAARGFFIRARQSRTGLAQTATPGRWARCRTNSRSGMSAAISRWMGSVEGLPFVVERLARVQIECEDALDLIRRYDSPSTLFYCDPPYPHESRGDSKNYGNEYTDDDHRRLAGVLHSVKGLVAVSGYRCDLSDGLYGDWRRVDGPERTAHSVKALRREALWANYEFQSLGVAERIDR
ncbi:MAG TPA: DNA adenine methylase [Thermoplasmata archaeon]